MVGLAMTTHTFSAIGGALIILGVAMATTDGGITALSLVMMAAGAYYLGSGFSAFRR